MPCDERGVPLQKINGLFAEPPPPKPKAVDDWSPFKSREHFTLAELIFCDTHMSAANTSKLMAIVADFRQGEPPFKDHSDLCNTIDASDLGDVLWQNAILRYTGEIPDGQVPKWMKAEYEIYYRDPRDVIKNMMADTTFKHAFDYVPYQEFDEDGYRRYENLMSGDWAFHQAVCFVLCLHQSADPRSFNRTSSRKIRTRMVPCLYQSFSEATKRSFQWQQATMSFCHCTCLLGMFTTEFEGLMGMLSS